MITKRHGSIFYVSGQDTLGLLSIVIKAIIPRWFYEWWNLFGVNKEILPQQFLNRFEDFHTKEEITILPEHIKICKYYIQKRISFIITWNFSKTDIDRIKYLFKEIQIKGWTPKQPVLKSHSQKTSSTGKTPSKVELGEKLKKALENLDKHNEKQIMQLIEEDMCNPKGMTLAYMDPNYEKNPLEKVEAKPELLFPKGISLFLKGIQ